MYGKLLNDESNESLIYFPIYFFLQIYHFLHTIKHKLGHIYQNVETRFPRNGSQEDSYAFKGYNKQYINVKNMLMKNDNFLILGIDTSIHLVNSNIRYISGKVYNLLSIDTLYKL